jgi:hypothetical protein
VHQHRPAIKAWHMCAALRDHVDDFAPGRMLPVARIDTSSVALTLHPLCLLFLGNPRLAAYDSLAYDRHRSAVEGLGVGGCRRKCLGHL